MTYTTEERITVENVRSASKMDVITLVADRKKIYYDTMYEYAGDADITHYRHSNADKDAPEILVEAFQPYDDPDFAVDWVDEIEKGDKTYIRVCWGESEKSYLAEKAIYECCFVRYELQDIDPFPGGFGEYIPDGIVYESSCDAEQKDEPRIMHTDNV